MKALENLLELWGLWVTNGGFLSTTEAAGLLSVECYGASPNKGGSKPLVDDSMAKVNKVIAELPERQRDVITVEYCATGAKTITQAGILLGMSPNTYRANLCRAKTTVKAIIFD